jgi:plasmid stability protein
MRMATIQVRNVPESVHRTLRNRAAAAGKSLQEYLLAELIGSAESRDLADVVAEARAEIAADPPDFSGVSSVAIVREDRDRQ